MKIDSLMKAIKKMNLPKISYDFSKKNAAKNAPAYIVGKIVDAGIIVYDGTVPYVCLGDHFQHTTNEDMRYLIPMLLEETTRRSIPYSCVTECIRRLETLPELQCNLTEKFWEHQFSLNLQNGVYDIRTQELRKHDSEDKFNYILNFDYIPNCKLDDAPDFKKFLETSLDEQSRKCLLFSLAYCLSSLTKGRKAFILLGRGKTGKSTILNLLESVIDSGLVSNEPFHTMASERSKAKYIGKRINISRENSNIPMKHEASFKSLISNEETSGRNLYENIRYFLPLLKFIFASNCELNFAHPDDAVYDRLVIIPFNKVIKEEERNINLDEDLKKDKNIIFSIIIDTLKELVESNYNFCMSKEAEDYIHHHRMILHSVEDFLDEKIAMDTNGSIPSTELSKLYEEWCHANNVTPIGRNHFYKHVKDYNSGITYNKVDSPSGRVNGFRGIRLKTQEEEEVYVKLQTAQSESAHDTEPDVADTTLSNPQSKPDHDTKPNVTDAKNK